MAKKNFMKGAALLGVAGIIVKIIGAMYRIPMTNILGTEGMGIYQKAYPIYSTLLVLSTAGLPTAISKMVSEHLSRGDRDGAQRVFDVSLKLLAVVGGVTALALFLGRAYFAEHVVGDSLVSMSLAAIAPSLFFVAVMSAYRGYFQGMQSMMPTAASQVVEQVGKLAIGIILAVRMLPMGLEYGAAGALIGVTASEFLALLYVMLQYARSRRRWRKELTRRRREPASSVLRRLLPVAIPIMLGACIMPLTTTVDSMLVTNRLEFIGYTTEQARSLYGNLTGAVNTLVNMPAVLSMALCMSLVPAIAEAKSSGNMEQLRSRAMGGLKIAMLIGLPASAGLMLLAPNIIRLLYGSMSAEELTVASGLLETMFLGILALGVVQTLNGVLQGMGRVYVPVFSLGVGAVVKVVLNYTLIAIPSINIYGAAISTVACYTVAALINLLVVARSTETRMSIMDLLLLPGLATSFMALAVGATVYLLLPRLGSTLVTVIAIGVGGLVYLLALPITGALNHQDLLLIPGGGRIERLLVRTHLMRGRRPGRRRG